MWCLTQPMLIVVAAPATEQRVHVKRRGVPQLTDAQVEEMRVRHEDAGWSYRQCARFYGVPRPTVISILKYRSR